MIRLMALLAAAIMAAALAACGSPEPLGGNDALSPPDDVVSSTPGDDSTGEPMGPRRVEPADGLVNVMPSVFEKARAIDEDTIEVFFYGGVEECYGLDRVEVDYGPRQVVVALFTGSRVNVGACIEIAEHQVTAVELDEPLDGRKIIDGS